MSVSIWALRLHGKNALVEEFDIIILVLVAAAVSLKQSYIYMDQTTYEKA